MIQSRMAADMLMVGRFRVGVMRLGPERAVPCCCLLRTTYRGRPEG